MFTGKQSEYDHSLRGVEEALQSSRSEGAARERGLREAAAELRREKDGELEQIHRRVRATIARKDDAIAALRARRLHLADAHSNTSHPPRANRSLFLS